MHHLQGWSAFVFIQPTTAWTTFLHPLASSLIPGHNTTLVYGRKCWILVDLKMVRQVGRQCDFTHSVKKYIPHLCALQFWQQGSCWEPLSNQNEGKTPKMTTRDTCTVSHKCNWRDMSLAGMGSVAPLLTTEDTGTSCIDIKSCIS